MVTGEGAVTLYDDQVLDALYRSVSVDLHPVALQAISYL